MTNEESNQASSPGPYDQPDTTQSVPGYLPPPPVGGQPGEPSWAAPAALSGVPTRSRLSEAAVLGTSIGMSLALVLGLPAAVITLTPVGEWVGYSAQQQAQGGAPAEAGQPAPAAAAPLDLREGGVFLQSNNPNGNEVVAFARAQDGTLTEVGKYPTGGLGSGSFEDSAGAVVLGTSEGEASPMRVVDKAELLFVPNAGSSTISVFRLLADGLELATEVSSGGEKPVSLTVSRGLLYVLNSGEFDDRLLLSETEVLENCAHGQLPSVTGFRVSADGNLTPIEHSTRLLSEEKDSGCAQVSFTPDGKSLVVTERIATVEGSPEPNKGAIVTFTVRTDGTLGNKQVTDPVGIGPFGFAFTKDGNLVTSEATGALANPGGGNAASYLRGPGNTWEPTNGSIPNSQTDTCWVLITDNQKVVFTSAPFPGNIASYRLGQDGSLTLIDAAASAPNGVDGLAGQFTTDMSLNRDGKFLYALDSNQATVTAFEVSPDGSLEAIATYPGFDQLQIGEGGELDSFGIAAF